VGEHAGVVAVGRASLWPVSRVTAGGDLQHGMLGVRCGVAEVSIILADRERHDPHVRAQPRSWDAAGAPSSETTGFSEE
jgi:hypothetical protein